MDTKYTYKNISDQALSVPDVGVVQPGENVETDEPINNANFELVAGGDTAKSKKINDETEIK